MRRTAVLKNDNTAEKRREEEAFALKSIAHYCFVEIKSNCGFAIAGVHSIYKRSPTDNGTLVPKVYLIWCLKYSKKLSGDSTMMGAVFSWQSKLKVGTLIC